jgi:hypothetical protein
MKASALAMVAFVAGGELFIMSSDSDDRAGGVFMGILITFGALVIVAVATMLERIVRDAKVAR